MDRVLVLVWAARVLRVPAVRCIRRGVSPVDRAGLVVQADRRVLDLRLERVRDSHRGQASVRVRVVSTPSMVT